MSTEEWSLVARYLLLQGEDAGQPQHDLREVFNGLLHRKDGRAVAVDAE